MATSKTTTRTPRGLVKGDDAAARLERANRAKDEARRLKAWEDKGSKGRRPATPNLDALNAAADERAEKRGRTSAMAPGLRFFQQIPDRAEKRLADSSNKYSCLAWQYTRGCDKRDPERRLSTEELTKVLKRLGVTDPLGSEWTAKLPNGVVLSARFETAHGAKAAKTRKAA